MMRNEWRRCYSNTGASMIFRDESLQGAGRHSAGARQLSSHLAYRGLASRTHP